MEQIPNPTFNDGLVLMDPKRKRSDPIGTPSQHSPLFLDLNGSNSCPKNLLRAEPVSQASQNNEYFIIGLRLNWTGSWPRIPGVISSKMLGRTL